MSRRLQVGSIHAVGPEHLWLVDRQQPVAAVLHVPSGELETLVDWRAVPFPDPGSSTALSEYFATEGDYFDTPTVQPDGDEVWVQHGTGGTIARVGMDGVRQLSPTAGTALRTAGGPGAWCAVPQLPDEHSPLPNGCIELISRNGEEPHQITVDGPVEWMSATDDGLFIRMFSAPMQLIPDGRGGADVAYPTIDLFLPWSDPVPNHIGPATHAADEREAEAHWYSWRGRAEFSWHEPEQLAWSSGLQDGDLHWLLGWEQAEHGSRSRIERPMIATAHAMDRTEKLRVELGVGSVVGAAVSGGYLWVDVRRERFLYVDWPGPDELVRIDPSDGQVETIDISAIDITSRCRPRIAKPSDADDHAVALLQTFSDLDRMWHNSDGYHPLAGGMSDSHAWLDGEWPDQAVVVSFRHPYLDGGRLQRRLPIFDEFGRPLGLSFSDIHLMEDLDTNHLPPPDEADDGVLWI